MESRCLAIPAVSGAGFEWGGNCVVRRSTRSGLLWTRRWWCSRPVMASASSAAMTVGRAGDKRSMRTCAPSPGIPASAQALYLAAAGGAVYRSADDGVSWTLCPRDARPAESQAAQLLVAADDPQRLYLRLDDSLWSSADSGEHWARYGEGLPDAVAEIAADPAHPGGLYAIADDTLYYCTAPEARWEPVGVAGAGQCLALATLSGKVPVLLAAWAGSGIARSDDRGASWSAVEQEGCLAGRCDDDHRRALSYRYSLCGEHRRPACAERRPRPNLASAQKRTRPGAQCRGGAARNGEQANGASYSPQTTKGGLGGPAPPNPHFDSASALLIFSAQYATLRSAPTRKRTAVMAHPLRLGSFSDRPVLNTRAVARETGVPADTFRAWERRYGVPRPQRTAGLHRLYSDRDVAIIRWLRDRTTEGVNISQAVQLLLNTIASEPEVVVSAARPLDRLCEEIVLALIEL